MKRIITLIVSGSLLMTIITAQGKLAAYEPNNLKLLSKSETGAVILDKPWIHNLGINVNRDGSRTITDTIALYFEPNSADSYDDFLAGYQTTGDDSVICRYRLLTEGRINEMHAMVETGGNVQTWIYGPAVLWVDEDGDGIDDTGWYQYPGDATVGANNEYEATVGILSVTGFPTTFNSSDPDQHFTGEEWTPWAAPAGTGWQVFDWVPMLGAGVAIDGELLDAADDDLFIWAGFSGVATIFQDGAFHDPDDDGNCPSWSTLHSQSPIGEGAWYRIIANGTSLYRNHLMQIVVEYDAVPPFIEEMAEISDTFDETKTIWADVTDMDGDAFVCSLFVSYNSGGWDDGTLMAQDGNRFYADVTALVGDTVWYYIRTMDVTGKGLNGSMDSYIRLSEPIATQQTLVIQDGDIDSLGLYVSATGLNPILLGNENTKYYIWNTNDRDGIDASVINHPTFNTIVKYGYGGAAMASEGADEAGFADFMNRGGRMLLVDTDYLFATDLPGSGTFVEGDFAFDFLGVLSYVNDPADAENHSTADLTMVGVANDPVTDPWTATAPYGPIDYENLGWTNWGDFITARTEASDILFGSDSYNSMAVKYNGLGSGAPFKSIYFTFPIEGAIASQFSQILSNSINWLNGTGGPTGNIVIASPENGAVINITSDNVDTDSLDFMFLTLAVSDPDDDLIGYQVRFTGDLTDLVTQAVAGSPTSIPYSEIAALMNNNTSITVDWSVIGTDGIDELVSPSRSITITTGALSVDKSLEPNRYLLNPNYPNPFNPETTISFSVQTKANVVLQVKDILGRHVASLVAGQVDAGSYSLMWNGKDGSGLQQSSGIYFTEIIVTDLLSNDVLYHNVQKMVLMK